MPQEKITKNVEREILNHYSLIHVRPHAVTRQLPAVRFADVQTYVADDRTAYL